MFIHIGLFYYFWITYYLYILIECNNKLEKTLAIMKSKSIKNNEINESKQISWKSYSVLGRELNLEPWVS